MTLKEVSASQKKTSFNLIHEYNGSATLGRVTEDGESDLTDYINQDEGWVFTPFHSHWRFSFTLQRNGLKLIANYFTSWKSLQACYSKSQSAIILIAVPLTEQTCLAKLSGTMSEMHIKGLHDE